MHKIKLTLGLVAGAAILGGAAIAAPAPQAGQCVVLGFHEPHTNIYDGPTWCGQVSLSNIDVRGPLQLKGTSISGKTDVHGPLTLIGANIHNVYLHKQLTPVKVNVENGTTVAGNVTFSANGPAGIVYLHSGSSISGRVVNGQIVKS